MQEVTAEKALEASKSLVEDLEAAASKNEDFAITPEQARRLITILHFVVRDPYPDLV